MKLLIKKLTDNGIVPFKAHPTDSGLDLFANEDVIIGPSETVIVKTGIAIQLPAGHEAQIRPRSGITAKTKLRVQLGTIDESYRGELGIIVDNIGNDLINIPKDMKLAQLVIAPVSHPQLLVVEQLDNTERNNGGFGSTGV